MPETTISTLAELTLAIDSAWDELQSFLAGLTEEQTVLQDDNGWTVKDHATHMAVWEDSVAILFRGQSRHQALGITESFYAAASFDQINETIRAQHSHLPLIQARRQLEQIHGALLQWVKGLSNAGLKTAVRDFFPQAPRTDDRPMLVFIHENTADHFAQHLHWMQALVETAA